MRACEATCYHYYVQYWRFYFAVHYSTVLSVCCGESELCITVRGMAPFGNDPNLGGASHV